MKKICLAWSGVVGLMDALTGLMLIVCPAWVLSQLGLAEMAGESMLFLRWIGVFVASVGMSYAWAFRGDGSAVWRFTSLVRVMVAVFVTANIVAGSLAPAWAGVAVTDAVVAAVQIYGLVRRWWS
ncbi:MAG: hypothetical protein MUF31_17185 [Akkermansiaceae bacterium]|jgi:hypothetical protein|nr:hypothetical protein [Akkermansiaceae bacterium]